MMKKTFLLAGVAASLFAFNANAFDFQQYISGKLSYTLTDNTALDLGYRYTDSGDVTLHDQEGNKAKFASQSHEILLGIRYTF